jgi:thiol-disulfide isomerase/thioredoxin
VNAETVAAFFGRARIPADHRLDRAVQNDPIGGTEMSTHTIERPSNTGRPAPLWRAPWKSPMVWVLGLVVGAALGAFVLVDRHGDDDTGNPVAIEVAAVTLTGDRLPPFDEPDPGLGRIAPTFTAMTFDGATLTLDATSSKGRVYGFFAHWCPHCRAELPILADWFENNEPPDAVDFVAVSTGVDPSSPNYPPSAWFESEGFSEPVVVDDQDGSLGAAFGLTGFPYWVVIDARGIVVQRASGELTAAQFASLLTTAAG